MVAQLLVPRPTVAALGSEIQCSAWSWMGKYPIQHHGQFWSWDKMRGCSPGSLGVMEGLHPSLSEAWLALAAVGCLLAQPARPCRSCHHASLPAVQDGPAEEKQAFQEHSAHTNCEK